MSARTYATGARRDSLRDADQLDDFPTPPWATRALFEKVLSARDVQTMRNIIDPACGRGHMGRVFYEYCPQVDLADIVSYGLLNAGRQDFLERDDLQQRYDWIITNPPFRLAEAFVTHALPLANRGVAMLVRTQFLEGRGRYERLFAIAPPSCIAQFVERVPMVRGKLDRFASTATAYCWLVWKLGAPVPVIPTKLVWIAPCRDELEHVGDYDHP